MNKKVKKVLISCIAVLIVSTGITLTYSCSNNIYFTTRYGLELTKVQYDNLKKVFRADQINEFAPGEVDDIKDDPNLLLEDSDKITVETRTYYDENDQPVKSVHKEVSEGE